MKKLDPALIDGGAVQSIVAGTNVTVDSTDPKHPIVAASGGGGSGAGGVIAAKSYAPATQQTYSPTSSTYVDMDATNLAVTFTAPSSGKVMIQTGIGFSVVGGSLLSLNLREGTTNLSGAQRVAGNVSSSVGVMQGSVSPIWVRTGLTSGTSYTYKLGMSRLSGTAAVQFVIDPSSVWGQVHIVVSALP